MRIHQEVIAATLVACLVFAPFGDWLTALRAATPPDPAVAKHQVELFGVGTVAEVKLASGQKLKGSIGAIDADGFDLISGREGVPRRITYDAINELKLKANSTYRSSGPPNVEEARRVVAGLGVGRHVAVKVASGQTFRGHLRAINGDHFVLLLDQEAGPLQIAYADVQDLGPNLSRAAKIAIWVGVGVAVLLVIFAIAVSEAAEQFGF